MDSTVLDEEELLAKHRKERKDLQAEIQKLKKGVSKGDKKRKKEVTEEIAKLEAGLDAKQEEELAALKNSNKIQEESQTYNPESKSASEEVEEAEESEVAENDPVQKKSKAQKRRDKKQMKDREREERIQVQAVENRSGPRQQELLKVLTMLKESGLALHEIQADGNCMYNAVGHQLTLRSVEASCTELRKKTATYMRDHPDDFLPFLTHPDTGDMMTLDEFSAYCDKTAKSPVWGGQIELRALSEVLDVPIQVLQADVPPLLIGETKDGPPITVVYQRHAYRLGEHYNSVIPKDYGEADGQDNDEGVEDGVDLT